MLAEVLRSEKALFFGGNRSEVDRMRCPLRGVLVGASEFEQDAAACAVIRCSVVYAVTFRVGVDAEVIVVGSVEDGVLCAG